MSPRKRTRYLKAGDLVMFTTDPMGYQMDHGIVVRVIKSNTDFDSMAVDSRSCRYEKIPSPPPAFVLRATPEGPQLELIETSPSRTRKKMSSVPGKNQLVSIITRVEDTLG